MMRLFIQVIGLSLLFGLTFGQDYGRMQVPGIESGSDEVQAALALEEETLALEGVIDPDQYILGPGDKLGLNIQDAINHTLPLTVTPTGDLFIPAVGVCNVAGSTLNEGKELVRKFIIESAYPTAHVDMVLVHPRNFLIQVNGAVKRPGFIEITPLTRLDQVIKDAGGYHQLAKEFAVSIIRSTGKSEIVNFHKFILEGDLDSNPKFLEGDIILVPFGELESDGIVVRGSILGAGYDIIAKGETLGDFIRRQVVFKNNADLRNVTLTRTNGSVKQLIVVAPIEFDKTILKPLDVINFMWERGVMVNGFVREPGGFTYFPGYSVADYISLAGGNATNGNPRKVVVFHLDGNTENGSEVLVERGDVIYVPRTRKDIYFGDLSLLASFSAIASILLAYVAASK